MLVSVQQGNVPLHAHAEALVAVSTHRKIRTVKHRKIDVRLLGDPPQQRRLVLDRMAHQIRQPHASLRPLVWSFRPGAHTSLPSPVARLRTSPCANAASGLVTVDCVKQRDDSQYAANPQTCLLYR